MDIDPRRPITEQLQEPPKPLEPLTMPVITHIACRECGGVATMRTPSHPGARFCSVQCIDDLEKRLAASEPTSEESDMPEDTCPFCGFVGYKSKWHSCAREALPANENDPARQLIQGVPLYMRDDTKWELQDEDSNHRVWTSWLSGNLCGSLSILRAHLPKERQAMRQLLHERLQQFGDALLVEYDKQVFEEDT